MPKKILFFMCDQLRFDYLGCAGHRTIRTPNIDALAARGVRLDRTYVQSPICGSSRLSFYTGRNVRSHGVYWNGHQLRVGEMAIGDHLCPLGTRTVLCGKTHMEADKDGMARLGIDATSGTGALTAECGFELWDRNDGVFPDGGKKQPSHYNKHLKNLDCDAPNPWHQWVNSARPHLHHLSPDAKSCALTMVLDGTWKMVWVEGHRPMLFNVETDPDEFHDLGALEEHVDAINRLTTALFEWTRKQHNRVTISDQTIDTVMCNDDAVDGVYLGFWDENELNSWKEAQIQ